jgi:predicted patatin/cPLA2 family phospholipase
VRDDEAPTTKEEKNGATKERWLQPLRDAVLREGGTLKCHPSARPDGERGVRAVRQYWRTPAGQGSTSSYDDDDGDRDVVAGAVASAMASRTSGLNTLHHLSSNLRNNNNNNGAATAAAAAAAAAADPAHHPVLRALLERKRSGSKPGARSDGMRVGLAVEGGGMRGVISAGATGEVLRMGFADCFDVVYGSSAGAMNLTYFLAKQPEGVAAYQEDLVGGEFLDLMRMAAGGSAAPAMDVSYLVDGVMDGVTNRGLRWDRILASPVTLKVVATSLDTLTPVVLEGPWRGVEDLKQCLKASAAVPVFAGAEPLLHRGQRLVDAAVMEPIPVHAAAADGCTHVLVLCTRSLPPPPSSSSSSSRTEEDGAKVGAERERERERERRRLADAAAAGRVGVGIVGVSAGSGASALAPALVAACETDEQDPRRRGRLFSRIGDFINRRRGSGRGWGRGRDGAGAGAESGGGGGGWGEGEGGGESVSGSSSSSDVVTDASRAPAQDGGETSRRAAAVDNASTTSDDDGERRRAEKGGGKLSKAFNGMLYKTIRGALLNPPHMKDAWGMVDATKRLVDDDYNTDLDEALVRARDDPVAAAAAGLFPGRVATTGCQVGYMEHTGCYQLVFDCKITW